MSDGYALCFWALSQGVTTTETTIGAPNTIPMVDFDDLGTSVKAHILGSLAGFTGSDCTFRLHASNAPDGSTMPPGPIVATFTALAADGLFHLVETFTPLAGPYLYYVTVQGTSPGTPEVAELVFILEVSP